MLKLRMSRAISLLLLYVFMAWEGNFTSYVKWKYSDDMTGCKMMSLVYKMSVKYMPSSVMAGVQI